MFFPPSFMFEDHSAHVFEAAHRTDLGEPQPREDRIRRGWIRLGHERRGTACDCVVPARAHE